MLFYFPTLILDVWSEYTCVLLPHTGWSSEVPNPHKGVEKGWGMYVVQQRGTHYRNS